MISTARMIVSACIPLVDSMDRVGATEGNDPARCLVLMVKSKRITDQSIRESIGYLRHSLPNERRSPSPRSAALP